MRQHLRLLAAALLCLAAHAHAAGNPRDVKLDLSYVIAQPVVDPAGMDSWLRRLAGQYRVDGMVEVVHDDEPYRSRRCGAPPETDPFCKSIQGMVDCINVGAGPGVQCILKVSWPDMYEIVVPEEGPGGAFVLPGGVPFLAPSMLLMGLNPGVSGLTYLLVDHKGLPEGGGGAIAGDRATFGASCVNGPQVINNMRPQFVDQRAMQSCDTVMRIDAREGSSVVHLMIDFQINQEPFTRVQMTLRRTPPRR